MIDDVIGIITTVLLLPLQVVLIPIDYVLSSIEGIEQIPQAIQSLTDLIGGIPSTMLHLTGVSPILWNSTIVLFLLFITITPTINIFKAVWEWVRP